MSNKLIDLSNRRVDLLNHSVDLPLNSNNKLNQDIILVILIKCLIISSSSDLLIKVVAANIHNNLTIKIDSTNKAIMKSPTIRLITALLADPQR